MDELDVARKTFFENPKKTKQSNWKNFERKIAKAVGGKRSLRGQDFSISDSDIIHDKLVVECKYRKTVNKGELDKQLQRYQQLPSNKSKLPISVYQYPGTKKTWVRLESRYYYYLLKHLYNNRQVHKLGELIIHEPIIAPNPYIEIELNDFLEIWQNIENRW